MDKQIFDAIFQAALGLAERRLDDAAKDLNAFLEEMVTLVEEEMKLKLTADDKKKLRKAIVDAIRQRKLDFFRDAIDRAFS